MKPNPRIPVTVPDRWRSFLAVTLVVFVAAVLTNEGSAQTLKMKFDFEDVGTTSTDSVANVSLRLVDSTGALTDLHGVVGSGVAGKGQALDLSSAVSQGGSGPMAVTTNNTTITFGTINAFTMTMWIKPTSSLLANAFPRFFTLGTNGITDRGVTNSLQLLNNGNLSTGGTNTSVQAFVNAGFTATATYGIFNMPANEWRFLALTYDGTNISFYGGSESAPVTLRTKAALTMGTVNLPAAWTLMLGNRIASAQSRAFQGLMDDVRFYTGSADTNFVESVRQSVAPPTPPTGLIALGCNSQAALSWNGSIGALGYFVKRSDFSGGETNYVATTATNFTDTAVTVGATYYYTIAATNANGSVSSSEVSVTIAGSGSLVLNSMPTNQTTCEGSTAVFGVTATGPSLSYNWQYSTDGGTTWNDLGGGSSTYTTWATSSSDNNTLYRVVVSNPCGALISDPATLSVTALASITAQPVNQITRTNWSATFSIQGSGPSLTYQWRKGGVNLSDGLNVSGATNSVLTLKNVLLSDSGATIDCYLGNPCTAPILSSPATLTVITNALKLHFTFEDTGATTTDSVAGVSLNLHDATTAAADLHGVAGSGVGGTGKALDFSAGNLGGTGPLAETQGNSTFDFGSLNSFTITMWIKPSSNMFQFLFPRFFSLGVNGTTDRGTADSLQFLSNGNLGSAMGVQAWVNALQSSTAAFGFFDMPSNEWRFVSLVYDGAQLSAYGGSTSSSISLISTQNFVAGPINLGSSWTLMLGNRLAQDRSFSGMIDDVQFYLGAAPSNYIESVRQTLAPPAPVPTVIGTALNGTNLVLQFSTVAGPAYILEATTNLAAAVWTPVVTNTGTGATVTNTVPIDPAKPQQFLRYRAQ